MAQGPVLALAAVFLVILATPLVAAPRRENAPHSYGSFLASRGDTHLHSLNSDGATNISVIADVARQRGLDWVVITDHDEVPRAGECEAETDASFLCIKGQEITTLGGHVTALGIPANITTPWANYTMGEAMEATYAQGGLAFVAHPFEDSAASDYEYFGVYENYTGLEIYHGYAGWNQNALSSDMDQLAVQKWDQLLNAGRRIVGIGASDSHNANDAWDQGDLFTRRGAVGYPRNVAYLREFSERGVLEALERGRLYVTDGPELLFTLGGAIPGDEVQAAAGSPLAVILDGVANVSSTVRLIANGTVVYSQAVAAGTFNLSTSYTPGQDSWIRAEVRSFNGNLLKGETYLAFSDPVFIDVPPYDAPPSPPTNLSAVIEGDSVVLRWDPPPDADLDHYAVYLAPSPSTFDLTWRTARPRATTWRHVGAAVDGGTYYYQVRSVDDSGHEGTSAELAVKMAFPVVPGPNLLSLPIPVLNASVASVLQTVSHDTVRRHDATLASPWKAAYGTRPGPLAVIPTGSAFWVNATAAGTYAIAGTVPPSVTVLLKAGWNLVSYASHTPRSIAAALAGIPWTRVEVFDPGTPPYRLRAAASPDLLAPGAGLWVHVTADASWTLTA